jgi:hypothetical protein
MKKAVLALAAALALMPAASAPGDDFSQGKRAKAAPAWKVLAVARPARRSSPSRPGLSPTASYFEGNATGPYVYAKQWWSNLQAYTLTSLVGNTLTLTAPLDTVN